MKLFIKLAQFYIPGFYKRKIFKQLVHLTARAFQCSPPEIDGLSFPQALRRYAEFTRNEAEKIIRENQHSAVMREKLFGEALELGKSLRQKFFIKSQNEAFQFAGILYQQLEIDFCFGFDGTIEIPRCFFSQFYSSKVCELISGLDEGILVGLSGGGNLKFQQRITDGSDCCRAIFQIK